MIDTFCYVDELIYAFSVLSVFQFLWIESEMKKKNGEPNGIIINKIYLLDFSNLAGKRVQEAICFG